MNMGAMLVRDMAVNKLGCDIYKYVRRTSCTNE